MWKIRKIVCEFAAIVFVLFVQDSHGLDTSIMAPVGTDVNLTCEAGNNFKGLEWRRKEDPEDKYVFVFRNGKPSPEDQLSSFKGRVEQQTGSANVILRNVTFDDKGTYECRVKPGETPEMVKISTIILGVPVPGNMDGSREKGGTGYGSDHSRPEVAVIFAAAGLGQVVLSALL